MVETRALMATLALALAACGGGDEEATVVQPVVSAGSEVVAPAAPTGPPLSYVAEDHQVVVRINMEAVRSSTLSDDIASLVQSYPTWRDLLGSSGIDPVRDFDAVLVSAPGVIADGSTLLIRHHLGNARIRDAVLAMAVEQSERPAWREVEGFSVVDWPAETRVPRVVVLTGENELVVTTPDGLDHVITVARDHAARREHLAGGGEEGLVEPALRLEPGLIANIVADEVGEGGRRMRYPPEAFTLTVREDANVDGRLVLSAHATYADADAAAQARDYYSGRRDFYAGQMLVRAVGLDRPLREATIGGEGNALDLNASFTEEEIQRVLGLVALGQLGGT